MTQVSATAIIEGALQGKVVSFPTDTVPALAAIPSAADKIFTLKQRPLNKPLILMGAKAEDLWPFIKGDSASMWIWQAIAQKHWPGALTLILPASEQINPQLNPQNSQTIGIRVPDAPVAQSILAETGPLATTSANISGQPTLVRLEDVAAQFPEVLTLKLGNETSQQGSGSPSTVAKWEKGTWKILRQGAIEI